MARVIAFTLLLTSLALLCWLLAGSASVRRWQSKSGLLRKARLRYRLTAAWSTSAPSCSRTVTSRIVPRPRQE